MTNLAVLAAGEAGRVSSMFVFFFIALLLVSPFGYRQISSVLRERRASTPAVSDDVDDSEPEQLLERKVRPVGDLADVIDAITTAGHELAGTHDEERIVSLHDEPLVEGRREPPAVVSALIDDAVRRSGLLADVVVDDNGRKALRLRAG